MDCCSDGGEETLENAIKTYSFKVEMTLTFEMALKVEMALKFEMLNGVINSATTRL